jgi:probable HAF family extracellular repeat protein
MFPIDSIRSFSNRTPARERCRTFFALTALVGLAACEAPSELAAPRLAPPASRATLGVLATIDLGSLGGGATYAEAVGKRGYITGGSYTAAMDGYHAFVWSPTGGMKEAGKLGSDAIGWAVNSNGEIAGVFWQPNPRAFYWSPNTGMVDIGVLPGGRMSWANGINASGTVVGWSEYAPSPGSIVLRGFTWTPQTGMKDIGDLGGGMAEARAINDAGWIVGWSYRTGGGSVGATLWKPGAPPQDLGTPGVNSQAETLNDYGWVAGEVYANQNRDRHAMYWRDATGMVDVGTLGGRESGVMAINNGGNLFGFSDVAGGTGWHPFRWNSTNGMTDLLAATGFQFVSGANDYIVVGQGNTAVKLVR